MSNRLRDNLGAFLNMLGKSADLKVRRFRLGQGEGVPGVLLYLDGLVDEKMLAESVLRPLKEWPWSIETMPVGGELLAVLEQDVLCTADCRPVYTLPELADGCLYGSAVLLVEGCAGGLLAGVVGWEKRAITEPQSETVVRGPREGFTENLRTNTSLIRRKLRNGELRTEQMTVGRKSRTMVCLMYMDGIADPKVVDKVKFRIGKLDVESILESGYIEEYIEDAPFSPFATVGYTEKPDVAAARLLDGRVAILTDGTPFVLTAPMQFIESFQTAEDYYTRPFYATLLRGLRYMAYILTVFAPAIYIALTVFHQELIPTTLLFSIAKAREGTPFPAFLEAAIMVFAYELLREAGVRLPRPVGQAISIVGALIMGDAAVSAGIVGAPMVITIAVTAVAGFLVPAQNDSASILRIFMMILAAVLGLYGISFGFLTVLVHLASLESFGVPYFDSFSHLRDMEDALVRLPLWSMTKRPRHVARGDTTRGHFFIPPLRPFAPDRDSGGRGLK